MSDENNGSFIEIHYGTSAMRIRYSKRYKTFGDIAKSVAEYHGLP